MGEKHTICTFVLVCLFIAPLFSVEAQVANHTIPPQETYENYFVEKTHPFPCKASSSLEPSSSMTSMRPMRLSQPNTTDASSIGQQRLATEQRAGTKYVGGSGPGNYSKIQDAIDDSTPGDTIFVYHGIYKESLQITTDDLTLIGENWGSTIIDGGMEGSIVLIRVNNTSIQGFTLQNSSTDIFNDIGIIAMKAYQRLHGIQVSHCIFRDSGRGVYLSNVSDSAITDCQIQNLSGTSISVLNICNNVSIDRCLIANCGKGMGGMAFSGGPFLCGFNFNCTNITITRNTIFNIVADGILLQKTNHVQVLNNTLHDCTWWGVCVAGQDLTIHGNNISKNLMNGIMTQTSSINIAFNRVTENGQGGMFDGGILLQDSDKNAVILNNTIDDNTPYGMYVIRSPGSMILNNDFARNTHNAYVYDTMWSHWHGNYWDDWKGIGPKIIKGWNSKWKIRWVNIDWHPAKEQ